MNKSDMGTNEKNEEKQSAAILFERNENKEEKRKNCVVVAKEEEEKKKEDDFNNDLSKELDKKRHINFGGEIYKHFYKRKKKHHRPFLHAPFITEIKKTNLLPQKKECDVVKVKEAEIGMANGNNGVYAEGLLKNDIGRNKPSKSPDFFCSSSKIIINQDPIYELKEMMEMKNQNNNLTKNLNLTRAQKMQMMRKPGGIFFIPPYRRTPVQHHQQEDV
jgi:hypothetical protein